jgi:hypothetical protein
MPYAKKMISFNEVFSRLSLPPKRLIEPELHADGFDFTEAASNATDFTGL